MITREGQAKITAKAVELKTLDSEALRRALCPKMSRRSWDKIMRAYARSWEAGRCPKRST